MSEHGVHHLLAVFFLVHAPRAWLCCTKLKRGRRRVSHSCSLRALTVTGKLKLPSLLSALFEILPSYAVYAAALWPSIALVTTKESTATAYGVVTAVQVWWTPRAQACTLHTPPAATSSSHAYRCVVVLLLVTHRLLLFLLVVCLWG